MVGRLLSSRDGLFSRAISVSGRVGRYNKQQLFRTQRIMIQIQNDAIFMFNLNSECSFRYEESSQSDPTLLVPWRNISSEVSLVYLNQHQHQHGNSEINITISHLELPLEASVRRLEYEKLEMWISSGGNVEEFAYLAGWCLCVVFVVVFDFRSKLLSTYLFM